MDSVLRVWIDDPNPIFRLGLACCLREPGFAVAGESSGFVPEPDLDRVDVLVFDLGEGTLGRTLGQAGQAPARLLGLVSAGGPEWEAFRGLCTVLARSELTPESFRDCLRSLTGASQPQTGLSDVRVGPGERSAEVPARLSPLELQVLRLLAEGESPQEIARGLRSSERTVRSIVQDLLLRMQCKNPAQAVARALREGVI